MEARVSWCLRRTFPAVQYCYDVLGCITHKGTGVIVPIEGNINSRKYINILDECLWPVVTKVFGNDPWILQEDNCPVHVSRETRRWKEDNQIQTLP